MVELSKRKWSDDYDSSLSVDNLRETFSPADRYRVSEFSYPAGTKLNGSMIAGKCFVLSGSVSYHYDDDEANLATGEWSELPAGSYELTIKDDCDAKLVLVWEIPTM